MQCWVSDTEVSGDNDPRKKRTIRAHLLICWSCAAVHPPPLPTRQPVLQLITGLNSKMGQMSTPGPCLGTRAPWAEAGAAPAKPEAFPQAGSFTCKFPTVLTQDSVGNASGGRSQGALWQRPPQDQMTHWSLPVSVTYISPHSHWQENSSNPIRDYLYLTIPLATGTEHNHHRQPFPL